MKAKTILTLVGVCCFTFALCSPEGGVSDGVAEEPMALEAAGEGKREVQRPEVVLQLKYDGGALNRIYLAQFRQGQRVPSVPARTDLCADLCHAGLGGTACGSSCPQLMPVGLQNALSDGNSTDVVYGEPRVYVCPTLCENHLGEPLCSCGSRGERVARKEVDWNGICDTFCIKDRYVLAGCPACRENYQSSLTPENVVVSRLNTAESWSSWCNVQCRQGQGGAACNCDRAPFQ
ncbi:PREDICTED: uncharacterized protein LOC106101340 [Papilio polytes]|uniref:uncharacterized protein LOC106101340 n=1 Tax=Papilio polytes TaxID=76194 RepID=UPI0006766387|nr:PREDICTED: uncharacterized protein LOC106101340 [Papilio polytes]